MRLAYGVQAAQISGGPSWIRSEGFDIEAKTDNPQVATKKQMEEQVGPLFRHLLEDRFQLKVHRETRQSPVYSLVAGKNGARLKTSTAESATMNNSMHDGRMVLQAEGVQMAGLVALLAKQLGRPVADKTGLAGKYDLRLEWSPELGPDSTAGSIFSALQEQLGLKIETVKGTVDVVVVDSASRPSEN
jgi:uncharacterized protein (TIGR03435 family)